MFFRRKTVIKKLLSRQKKQGNNEARRSAEGDLSECPKLVESVLKKLEENQLTMLLKAVDSRGQDMSNCVLVPRGNCEPHVLCCQMWRWPDLRQCTELRRLPMCHSACDPVYFCCNPYHWSRLCQPETPPPPYSRCSGDMLKPEDRAPSEARLVCRNSFPESLTTNGDSYLNSLAWCNLAYWETNQRVGPIIPVESTAVNVYGDVPLYGGDGISLKTLAKHSFTPPGRTAESVVHVREKIGLGVTISREEDSVWLYNRSDFPIFVNSPTLEDPCSPNPTRVPEGHCLCVFDAMKAAHQNYGWNFSHASMGPIDLNSIKISFAKGWGTKYSRREISSCPCWLEILLEPCR